MPPCIVFRNRNTRRACRIIKREKTLVLVRYLKTGSKSWYGDADFTRLFEMVPRETKKK